MRARISSPIAFGIQARRDRFIEPQDHAEVLHVGADGLGDAGVLHLHRDVAAVGEVAL